VPAVVSSAEAVLVPADEPAQLADALHSVLADPAAARTRAVAARERLIESYGVESWVAQYDAVYRAVIAGAKGKRRGFGFGVSGSGERQRQ
jgi:hypothetical protein